MSTALLYGGAAALLVVVLGVLLFLAANGAALARALQDRRYRKLESQSDRRATCIRTDRALWEAQQREARDEQKARHRARTRQLNDWHREYSGY